MALNENDNDYNRLAKLSGSDFEIADGQPNIKGWKVKNSSGLNCGEVDELIFNPASRKVRYLVVDLDDNEFNLNSRKVVVPIGLATLHEREDNVILSGVTTAQLQELPDYEGEMITPATESKIRNLFTGVGASGLAGYEEYTAHEEGFYEHDHFDEDRFYGDRRPSARETSTEDPTPTDRLSTESGFETFEEEEGDVDRNATTDEEAIRNRLKNREGNTDEFDPDSADEDRLL